MTGTNGSSDCSKVDKVCDRFIETHQNPDL